MPRRNWNRHETLVAFNLYCRTPFGRLTSSNPDIIAVASAIDRTPSSVAMKCCNLAALDPSHQARGVRGLSNAARLDAEIWDAFRNDPEQIAFDAELAYSEALAMAPRVSEFVEWEDIQGLDKTQLAKVRVNQHYFRAMILTGYRSQCAICELPIASLLVASHIVPWSVDKSLRMNPRNGICLCSLHDRAFDLGLITIDRDHEIRLNSVFSDTAGVESVAACFLKYQRRKLRLPERWVPDPDLLEAHANLALARVASRRCSIRNNS